MCKLTVHLTWLYAIDLMRELARLNLNGADVMWPNHGYNHTLFNVCRVVICILNLVSEFSIVHLNGQGRVQVGASILVTSLHVSSVKPASHLLKKHSDH